MAELLNIPAAEYHKMPGLSSSKIRAYAQDPGEFHWRYILGNGWDEPPTRAMNLGTVFHLAVLQPELVHEQAVVSPYSSYRTNEAKDWRQEQEEAGVIVLTEAEMKMVENMQQACSRHEAFRDRFRPDGLVEHAITFEYMGEPCRVMLDYHHPDTGLVIDLKSTTDPSPRGFRQSVRKYRYDIQDYIYREGFCAYYGDWPGFLFLAAGKGERHPVALYELGDMTLSKAAVDCEAAVVGIREQIWKSPWETGVQILEVW